MRLTAIVFVLLLSTSSSIAETFKGRTVLVTDGRRDKAQAAPVVVVMHGFLGSSAQIRRTTGFDTLAKKRGFVVVYPSGLRRRWNDGRNSNNATDDVAYLSALIATLVADGRADPRRVFWAGHSNGGGMAMRMACDRPDLSAGIAVIATKVPAAFQCATGAPVPAIFFHGTRDPIAPHAGRLASSRLGETLSAKNSLKLWQGRNKCSGATRARTINRVDDGTEAKIINYTRCRAALTHVEIQGHGHGWPSRSGRATRLQGPATKELSATQLSWRFFSQF